MRKTRYEIKGIWDGPTRSVDVHREITTDEIFAQQVEKLGSIMYTDGTHLYLQVRPLEKGERKGEELHGYTRLIRDCVKYGVNRVSDLPEDS